VGRRRGSAIYCGHRPDRWISRPCPRRPTPGFAGAGKADAQAELASLGDEIALLQKQLFAQGRAGGSRRLLLVLQGMDTSGKGATVEHVLGMANPMGVRYHAFTRPTIEEREHHFLWRVMRRLPPPGIIGVFDRSHYEDVLVVRVHQLVPPRTVGDEVRRHQLFRGPTEHDDERS
jgi:polyphosphate kinase 2 (PPK2 family)